MTIIEGGCYCGAVRYRAEGEPIIKAECFCRECQHITGGGSLFAMAMPADGFAIIAGATKSFTRSDILDAVTREFCPTCGTHMISRAPAMPSAVILKVGSFDDPALFGGPESANFTCDAQPWHNIPDSIPVYRKWGSERV